VFLPPESTRQRWVLDGTRVPEQWRTPFESVWNFREPSGVDIAKPDHVRSWQAGVQEFTVPKALFTKPPSFGHFFIRSRHLCLLASSIKYAY